MVKCLGFQRLVRPMIVGCISGPSSRPAFVRHFDTDLHYKMRTQVAIGRKRDEKYLLRLHGSRNDGTVLSAY
jgi:hypothetical protein